MKVTGKEVQEAVMLSAVLDQQMHAGSQVLMNRYLARQRRNGVLENRGG